jgi:hypothetical protein
MTPEEQKQVTRQIRCYTGLVVYSVGIEAFDAELDDPKKNLRQHSCLV